MDPQDTKDQPAGTKQRIDRGKLIFGIVIAVAVVAVYMFQRSGAELPKWPGDLAAALAQAEKEDRKILVFFAADPPSTTARNMSTKTLKHNAKNIKTRKLICVLVRAKQDNELTKRYKISSKKLPVFLLLDSKGKELNRRSGFVGQTAFGGGFLDCQEVQVAKP